MTRATPESTVSTMLPGRDASREGAARPGSSPSVWWSVRSRAHIDLVSRSPRRATGRYVAVRVAQVAEPSPVAGLSTVATRSTSAEPPRLLLAVGRQVGPAVVRNRIRRRIRHAVRECPASARLSGGSLVMVRAVPAAAQASWSELAQDVGIQLGRALDRPAAGAGPDRGAT